MISAATTTTSTGGESRKVSSRDNNSDNDDTVAARGQKNRGLRRDGALNDATHGQLGEQPRPEPVPGSNENLQDYYSGEGVGSGSKDDDIGRSRRKVARDKSRS